MGRHATREEEVDRLLRGEVFVDLFRAVRQGLRASVESYSIKKLEPLYGLAREEGLRDAGRASSPSRAGWPRWTPGPAAPRSPRTDETLLQHRALQPRRLRLQLAAARLAGGAAGRAGGRDRRAAAAAGAGRSPSPPSLSGPARPRRRGRGPAVRRRARRRGGAHARTARPLAPGPAAELAPPRGEVVLVALLRPDERPHRRGAGRRARADRRLELRRCRRQEGALDRLPLPLPGARARDRGRDARSAIRRRGVARPRGRASTRPPARSTCGAGPGPTARTRLAGAVRPRRHGAAPGEPAADRRVGRRSTASRARASTAAARRAADAPAAA